VSTTVDTEHDLDYRESDGIAVTLLWYEDSNRVAVRVVDRLIDDEFEFDVAPGDALDAFRHPHAYRFFAVA
jgi:hypothetical protein